MVCTLSSGVKAYLYTQGKCIYTNQEYDHNNIANSEAHLTSLNLDAQIYNHLPETFTELQNTIGQVAYNFIWQKIIYKLKKIFFAIQKEKAICQDIKGTLNFQLFGVDVMLDDTLEPWILEFKKEKRENQTWMKMTLEKLGCLRLGKKPFSIFQKE